MAELLEFELPDGGTVIVEVAEDEPGIERAARIDDVVAKAGANLESTLDQVRAVANVALVKLRNLAEQPEQIEVEFGIRLNAEAGAVIARTQAEGHLQVKLTWVRPGAVPGAAGRE
jgi:hypothetical protein